MVVLFALSLGAMASGCARIRTVGPEPDTGALAADEGILLVHIRTAFPLASLAISGKTVAESIPVGEKLLVMAAKEGRYRWSRVDRYMRSRRYWYRLKDPDGDLQFDVHRGQINYPGSLVIGMRTLVGFADSDIATIQLINHSTDVLAKLDRTGESAIGSLPIRYSGPGRDPFLQRFDEALRRRRDADAVEASRP